ncbi:MAG: hypothetical protein AAF266_04365 [Planctomycetota bacterium]
MTILVAAAVVAGAICVGQIGGAFEANKLFASVLAAPLAVPLLGGLLLSRPGNAAAYASVLSGAAVALIMHLGGWLAWEHATLLAIAMSVAVYSAPVLLRRKPTVKAQQFFADLATPLAESEVPSLDDAFTRALCGIFAFALAITAVLFVISGAYATGTAAPLAFGVGTACGAAALTLSYPLLGVSRRDSDLPT